MVFKFIIQVCPAPSSRNRTFPSLPSAQYPVPIAAPTRSLPSAPLTSEHVYFHCQFSFFMSLASYCIYLLVSGLPAQHFLLRDSSGLCCDLCIPVLQYSIV